MDGMCFIFFSTIYLEYVQSGKCKRKICATIKQHHGLQICVLLRFMRYDQCAHSGGAGTDMQCMWGICYGASVQVKQAISKLLHQGESKGEHYTSVNE